METDHAAHEKPSSQPIPIQVFAKRRKCIGMWLEQQSRKTIWAAALAQTGGDTAGKYEITKI